MKGPNKRASLGFAEAVRAAFDEYLGNLGYRCVESDPTLVRYKSNSTFVNVYHGRTSYEIGLEVGQVSDPEGIRYRLPDILDGVLGPGHAVKTYFQASTRAAVLSCVASIARAVRMHLQPVLQGDPNGLKRIAILARHRDGEVTKKYVQGPVREKADYAWRRKDFERVKQLYESLEPDLTEVEMKRLEYARHKLHQQHSVKDELATK
jgi:hypothetical protein